MLVAGIGTNQYICTLLALLDGGIDPPLPTLQSNVLIEYIPAIEITSSLVPVSQVLIEYTPQIDIVSSINLLTEVTIKYIPVIEITSNLVPVSEVTVEYIPRIDIVSTLVVVSTVSIEGNVSGVPTLIEGNTGLAVIIEGII